MANRKPFVDVDGRWQELPSGDALVDGEGNPIGGGSGTPGGSDQQFQFNNNGVFAGSDDIYYVYNTVDGVVYKILYVGNPVDELDALFFYGTSIGFQNLDPSGTIQFNAGDGSNLVLGAGVGVGAYDASGVGFYLGSAGPVVLDGAAGVEVQNGNSILVTNLAGNSTFVIGIKASPLNQATSTLKIVGQNRKTGTGNVNSAGGAVEYHAGLGTGNAASAQQRFYCPIPGASGSSAQAEKNILTLTNARATVDGALRAGDSTNYFEISSAGSVTLAGTAKITHHQQIAVTAALVSGSSVAVYGTSCVAGMLANQNTDVFYFQWELYTGWDGTDIYVEVDWLPGSDIADGQTVIWNLSYRAVAEGEDVDSFTDKALTLTYTSSGATSAGKIIHSRFTLAYNDAVAPLTAEDHLFFKVSRSASTDTYNGDCIITAFEVLWTANSLTRA